MNEELNVGGLSLEDWVAREFDANPEAVAVAEAEHVLAPMRCSKCERDLAGHVEAADPDGRVGEGEYVVSVDITPERLGQRVYWCVECCNEQCGQCRPEWGPWPGPGWPIPGCSGCPRMKEAMRWRDGGGQS